MRAPASEMPSSSCGKRAEARGFLVRVSDVPQDTATAPRHAGVQASGKQSPQSRRGRHGWAQGAAVFSPSQIAPGQRPSHLPARLPASHSKDVTADLKPSPSMPLPIIFDALVQCLFYSYLPARPCSSVAQLAPLPVIPIFAPHSSFRYSHHPLQPVSATLPRVPHYSNSHTIPARADSRRPLVPSLSASSTTRSSL